MCNLRSAISIVIGVSAIVIGIKIVSSQLSGVISWASGTLSPEKDNILREEAREFHSLVGKLGQLSSGTSAHIKNLRVYESVTDQYSAHWLWIRKHGDQNNWNQWNEFVSAVLIVAENYTDLQHLSFESLIGNRFMYGEFLADFDSIIEIVSSGDHKSGDNNKQRGIRILRSMERQINQSLENAQKIITNHYVAETSAKQLRTMALQYQDETLDKLGSIEDPALWVRILQYIIPKLQAGVAKVASDRIELELISQHFAVSVHKLTDVIKEMEEYVRELLRLRVGLRNVQRSIELDCDSLMTSDYIDVDYIRRTKQMISTSLDVTNDFIASQSSKIPSISRD